MALPLMLLLLPGVRMQEVATPASLLTPRNFNHHPYDAQYLQQLGLVEPTKQGPVLFPNDSPPAARPPLIVTSRPLVESIARSELNNSLAQETQTRVAFKPGFLARIKDYRPFAYPVPAISPLGQYEGGEYPDPLKKASVHVVTERYNNYEDHTVLPPIYKVLSDHANEKVLKIQKYQPHHDYQINKPNYSSKRREDDNVDEQNKNYAFSYTVKDQKTGDDFSHSQHSSGSATNGEYRVRLPDGRMQIVSYTADENGYKADVRYDEEDNRIDNNYDDSKNYHSKNIDNNYDDSKNYDSKNINVQNDYKTDDNQKFKTQSNDYYTDSKEYVNDDVDNEYDNKNYDYAPHRSKYADFDRNNIDSFTVTTVKPYELKNYLINKGIYSTVQPYQNPVDLEYKNGFSASTVKPSYDALRNLLVNSKVYSTAQYDGHDHHQLSTPSTTGPYSASTVKLSYDALRYLLVNSKVYSTVQYDHDHHQPSTTAPFDVTTERVVVITNKPTLYTNIRNSLPVNPLPIFPKFVSSTPRSYLVSTIANLRNKISSVTTKPILSDNFINRINKYLSFN